MPVTSPRRIAILVLVSISTACAGSETASAPGAGGSPAAAEVLAFEAPLLDGGTFRGQDLAGKDVAFWFWAPW